MKKKKKHGHILHYMNFVPLWCSAIKTKITCIVLLRNVRLKLSPKRLMNIWLPDKNFIHI